MKKTQEEIQNLLILNGRNPDHVDSGERVVYLHDALSIVNSEFSKQADALPTVEHVAIYENGCVWLKYSDGREQVCNSVVYHDAILSYESNDLDAN